MKTNIHFWTYPTQFFLEREVFQTKFLEKFKTHFVFNSLPPPLRKSCRLLGNVEKYFRAGQATDDIMAQALCMLDTYGYKHTLRISIPTYCVSIATVVTRTRLNITLYIHFLSCLYLIAPVLFNLGTADGGTVVKALCYKSEGRWFYSRWCHWNFPLT
jgi:hypothetical protein